MYIYMLTVSMYIYIYMYSPYTCYLYELSCLKSVYSKITVHCISLEKLFTNLHHFITKKLKGGHTHTDTLCIQAL